MVTGEAPILALKDACRLPRMVIWETYAFEDRSDLSEQDKKSLWILLSSVFPRSAIALTTGWCADEVGYVTTIL